MNRWRDEQFRMRSSFISQTLRKRPDNIKQLIKTIDERGKSLDKELMHSLMDLNPLVWCW